CDNSMEITQQHPTVVDDSADDIIDLPVLKKNGNPNNSDDYFWLPVHQFRLGEIIEIMLETVSIVLLYKNDIQTIIDRLCLFGLKNDLLSTAFHNCACHKCLSTCELKRLLFAVDKNDPVSVNLSCDHIHNLKQNINISFEHANIFFNASLKLRPDSITTRTEFGYSYYFLFGKYIEAIDVMLSVINVQITDEHLSNSLFYSKTDVTCPIVTYLRIKLHKEDMIFNPIVIAYYTLFQSYRMVNRWNDAEKYIDDFEKICKDERNQSKSNSYILLATAYMCIGNLETAYNILQQYNSKDMIMDQLYSLCGICVKILVPLTHVNDLIENGVVIILPYRRSECGDDDEELNLKPSLITGPSFNQIFSTSTTCAILLRHGYDCYKSKPWLINELTIIDELEKWMSRLPPVQMYY
ncbi:unnamed protein product, partial [Didymodactylos carnosus]